MPPIDKIRAGYHKTRELSGSAVRASKRAVLGHDLNRSTLLETFHNNTDPLSQSKMIGLLEREGVIKKQFRGEARTLNELQDHMLSSVLTKQKLDDVFSSASKLDLLPFFGTSGESGKIEKATQTIWNIRETKIEAELAQLRALELTALLSTATRELSDDPRLLEKESGIAPEVKDSVNNFTNNTSNIRNALRGGFEEVKVELLKSGLMLREQNISQEERELFDKIASILNENENLELAGEEAINNKKTELISIISQFESIYALKETEGQRLKNITTSLKSLLIERDEEKKLKTFEELLLNINELYQGSDTKNTSVALFSLAAIIVPVFYIAFRLFTLGEPGYSGLDFAAAIYLFGAEAFCNYSSVINNIGIFKAIKKTKGASGQSWLPKIRNELSRDPFDRPKIAVFLSSFQEPVGTLLSSIRFAVREVWNYGSASLKILDDSFNLYNFFGILHSVRVAKKMSAAKEVIAQIACQAGVNDPVVCHELSSTLAARETEIDDAETRRFAILKAAQDCARNLNVFEKSVMKLADLVWKKFETDGEVTGAFVQKHALDLGIPSAKAKVIAREIEAKIYSIQRKSIIAKLANELLEGRGLSDTDRATLNLLTSIEHGIDLDVAERIFDLIADNHKKIYDIARAVTNEINFFKSEEGRKIYYRVHLIMEDMMKNDEKSGEIEVDMATKYRQIAQWLIKGRRGAFYTRIGEEITGGILRLPKFNSYVEEEFKNDPEITFEVADSRAWQRRQNEVRNIIENIGARYGLSREEIDVLYEGIIANLLENKEERKAAALEFLQYLAQKVADNKTPEQIIIELEAEKTFVQADKVTKEVKTETWQLIFNSLIPITKDIKEAYEAGNISPAALEANLLDPGAANPIPLNLDLIQSRVDEYVEMVHRDKTIRRYREMSGKAGAINNAIHGLTVNEQISEMLREIIHNRTKELFFDEYHVPEALVTYIDRHIVDHIPPTRVRLTNPKEIANHIITRVAGGEKHEDIITDLINNVWNIPLESRQKVENTLSLYLKDIEARLMLSSFLEKLATSPEKSVEEIFGSDNRFDSSDSKASDLIKLGHKIKEKVDDGTFLLFCDPLGKAILRLKDGEPQFSEGRKLLETVQHFIIAPDGRSATQIAENFITVRRLPDRTSMDKGSPIPFSPASYSPELRKYTALLDDIIRGHLDEIMSMIDRGASQEEISEQIISWATTEINYQDQATDRFNNPVNSPFEQMRPKMSSLKYDIIACYDADYRINMNTFHEMASYFNDHPDYFFLGKRQYGRNWPDSNMAHVMQDAQSGYWGYQNIANSIENSAASWGSCVYHSTHSYVYGSRWMTQKDYGSTSPWIKNNYGENQKDFTVFKFLNGIEWKMRKAVAGAGFLQELKKKEEFKNNRLIKYLTDPKRSYLIHPVFSLLKIGLFPAHVGHLLLGAWPRNWMHERALQGKKFLAHEKKENVNVRIDMLASQDFTEESEDIASCMWEERSMPSLYLGPVPLNRSGFVEGIGGVGSHANDYRAYEATDLTRWRRGNLILDWKIANTKMSFMAKRRYELLAQYWLLGLLRQSFLLSPVIFAFAGIEPIHTEYLPELAAAAFTSFGVGIGSYFYSMHSRGHSIKSSARAMLIDYYLTLAKANYTVAGKLQRTRAGFAVSPKKTIVPLKARNDTSYFDLSRKATAVEKTYKWEYALAGVNALAAVYAGYMAVATGNPINAALSFWSGNNAVFMFTALSYMNKGVPIDNPKENITNLSLKKTERLYEIPPGEQKRSEEGGILNGI